MKTIPCRSALLLAFCSTLFLSMTPRHSTESTAVAGTQQTGSTTQHIPYQEWNATITFLVTLQGPPTTVRPAGVSPVNADTVIWISGSNKQTYIKDPQGSKAVLSGTEIFVETADRRLAQQAFAVLARDHKVKDAGRQLVVLGPSGSYTITLSSVYLAPKSSTTLFAKTAILGVIYNPNTTLRTAPYRK